MVRGGGSVAALWLTQWRRRQPVLRITYFVEQGLSCAEDPALDRANSTTADRSGRMVRQAGNSNQKEGFAVDGRQPLECLRNVPKFQVVQLCRRARELRGVMPIAIGHFPAPGSQFPVVGVAQDCE
jgi:hypothetical protein